MVKKKIENGDSVAKIVDDLLEDANVIEKIYEAVAKTQQPHYFYLFLAYPLSL